MPIMSVRDQGVVRAGPAGLDRRARRAHWPSRERIRVRSRIAGRTVSRPSDPPDVPPARFADAARPPTRPSVPSRRRSTITARCRRTGRGDRHRRAGKNLKRERITIGRHTRDPQRDARTRVRPPVSYQPNARARVRPPRVRPPASYQPDARVAGRSHGRQGSRQAGVTQAGVTAGRGQGRQGSSQQAGVRS